MQDPANNGAQRDDAAVDESLASLNATIEVDEYHGNEEWLDDLSQLFDYDEQAVEEQWPTVKAYDRAEKRSLLLPFLDLFFPCPIQK